jgi:hypothetical protein
MICPAKVKRSTMAHSRGSEKVFVHEWLVGGDRDCRALFSLGEDLKQQFCTAPVQLQIAQLVDQDQIDSPVAIDQFGQLFVVGGFD